MAESLQALLVCTLDTKGSEARFLAACLQAQGVTPVILDAGIQGRGPFNADIPREKVAQAGGQSLHRVQELGHEGKALGVMIQGAIRVAARLYKENRFQGILGLGGSMGTTLGTAVMRSLPFGLPKVMISTMASRDTRPFVGTKDILMLHSVADISGLNRVTRTVLRNGALALAGMIRGRSAAAPPSRRPLVALSTLGTTEACAVALREQLERSGREVVVFHTVGAGGEAMEEMIREGQMDALIDLSLHEVADHMFGGDYDAGPARGRAALERKIPTVVVPGNIDFLVSGPLSKAKAKFPLRKYHVHNDAITVVRTEWQEAEQLAHWVARRCNQARGPIAVVIPLKGLSAFDRAGGPLHNPSVPLLFEAVLRKELKRDIPVQSLPHHINDPAFAEAVFQQLLALMQERPEERPTAYWYLLRRPGLSSAYAAAARHRRSWT